MTSLVPSPQPDDIDGLRLRLAELEVVLSERSVEVDRAKGDIATFKVRYRREVGELHEQLEELELQIAELELGEIEKRLEQESAAPNEPDTGQDAESAPKYTSDAVRRLFRDVAKAIHPDLAGDAVARDRRHALMIEANRAYALGDEERLRWILQAWERSPEAVQGDDPEATKLRLERRIAQVEEHLQVLTGELAELQDSPLWKLRAMVDESAAKGKDLVQDTVRRLRRDITAARNRLDAMRAHP